MADFTCGGVIGWFQQPAAFTRRVWVIMDPFVAGLAESDQVRAGMAAALGPADAMMDVQR